MRLRRLCLTALALVASPIGSARADSLDDISTTVLGLETKDVPPRVGDEIAEYLRQNVSNNHDLKLVGGKDLVELKLVFACADESHTCMALAGKSLNADWMIYGSIKRSGDNYIVWLKLFDVKTEKVSAWLTEPVSKQRAAGPVLKATVARWFSKLRGRAVDVGTLRVASDVPGAIISLDGVPMGAATVERPFVLAEIPPGKHVVALDKAGMGSISQTVALKAGETQDLALGFDRAHGPSAGGDGPGRGRMMAGSDGLLAPGEAGAAQDDATPPSSTRHYRTGFWVTLTAGLISAGAAVKYGLDVNHVNNDLDPYRRYSQSCSTGLCNSKGMPAAPLTRSDQDAATRLMNQGNRAHDLQWVCVGVGGVLGIASGYLLYKGYLDGENQSGEGGKSLAHRGLRIFPTAAASSGGVLAEFDF